MGEKLQDYVRTFRVAAIEKGDDPSTPRGLQLYEQMAAAYHALMASGPDGRRAFEELLTDESMHVRVWVAAALLHGGDPKARSVLEAITAVKGIVGWEAEVTLQEYDAGRLGSPFPPRGA